MMHKQDRPFSNGLLNVTQTLLQVQGTEYLHNAILCILRILSKCRMVLSAPQQAHSRSA
jgi:hypothetical protein